MQIKKIGARIVKDSRNEKTILVFVETLKGEFYTISPSGKSTGKYEVKPYLRKMEREVEYIKELDISKLNIKKFDDLKKVEDYVKLGGNSLFALEASLLKALAKDKNLELYELLIEKNNKNKIIGSVGNAVGGGLHSKGINNKKPDFQEFHFISKNKDFYENVKINNLTYNIVGNILKSKKRNDEGAWETELSNEEVLDAMKYVRDIMKKKGINLEIGLDIAASSFFNKKYFYKNPKMILNMNQQVEYVANLINKYDLFYVEDPLEENDFKGFKKLMKKIKNKCLIVGDDLIATSPNRLKKAIKNKSVNAVIVKPNQIGSMIKLKEVIDICKNNKIKIIISHRSGESEDYTIADFAIGFQADFIKTGIYGKVRESKLKRIIEIERNLKNE
ncbi:MAG: enolase C-terminal domain-like protein [Nanoarchaeota archaeon]